MNKKNKIIVLLSGVLVILLMIVGLSFAVFSFNQPGQMNQQLVLGDIWMKYTESNQLILEDVTPTNIDKYMEYQVNPVMQTQEIGNNELGRCIEIFTNWGREFDSGTDAEGFCKGDGTIEEGLTFQKYLDEWISRAERESTIEEGFLYDGGQELLDAGVVKYKFAEPRKIKTYKVNEEMTPDELNSCIDIYTNWDYEFDEGSDAESYCKGEGTAWGGYTIQDDIDDWSWYNHYFLMEGGQELLDAGIITEEIIEEKKYIVNPNITEEVINKCVTILRDEFDLGKKDDETWEDYCKGTGTNWGETFQENLNDTGYFYLSELNKLEENNIIVLEPTVELPYFEFKIC